MPKILVVDDEQDILELLTFNLEKTGYEVVTARDGPQAIELAYTCKPALILLDLMLPEIDGFAVCELLRQTPDTASIPIIILTAWKDEQSRLLGLELGAEDYITKPFSPAELVLRVGKVLRRDQATAETTN